MGGCRVQCRAEYVKPNRGVRGHLFSQYDIKTNIGHIPQHGLVPVRKSQSFLKILAAMSRDLNTDVFVLQCDVLVMLTVVTIPHQYQIFSKHLSRTPMQNFTCSFCLL